MSAITVHIEEPEEPTSEVEGAYYECARRPASLRGLGREVDASCPNPEIVLNQAHAGLLQLAWARQAALEQIQGARIYVTYKAGDVYLALDRRVGVPDPYCNEEYPCDRRQGEPAWNPAGTAGRVRLLSWTSKMGCPSFSLPSGHDRIGGSCPGAVQTIAPEDKWIDVYMNAIKVLGIERDIKPVETICAHCYAAHGKYATSSVQLAQLVRMAWVREAVKSGDFVDVMTWAVKNTAYCLNRSEADPCKGMVDRKKARAMPREPSGRRHFRIHDSGDFYSYAYLNAWKEVAMNCLDDDIIFWAPTRIWPRNYAYEDFGENSAGEVWTTRSIDAVNDEPNPPNMVIRPSAFHINERPPRQLGRGWAEGATTIALSQNRGMRTDWEEVLQRHVRQILIPGLRSSDAKKLLRLIDRAPGGPDDRYDWDCPAYLEQSSKHTCRHAVNPEGGIGCRVCWENPELRVNYTLHA